MSNTLVKKIALALFALDQEDGSPISERWDACEWKIEYTSTASVVLKAIEDSRTHVVVPVEPTNEMLMPLFHAHNDASGTITFEAIYAAILAARPKVTE